MPRSLLLPGLLALFVTACASPPQAPTYDDVPQEKVAAQQDQLAVIETFSARGRIAFFDDRADSREAARYHWQQAPAATEFRLYHSLRGTLARITADDDGAQLIDLEGNTHTGHDLTTLLQQQLGLALPLTVLNDAILGRLPAADTRDVRYYEDGTVAGYEVATQGVGFGPQYWQLEITEYTTVTLSDQSLRVPAALELTHPDYRIRLTISRWELVAP